MKHLVGLIAAGMAAIVALGSSNASANILASSTNAQVFESTSTVEVVIPIGNGGSDKALKFTTKAAFTRVKITYNAVCLVSGTRGRYLSIRILVDGVDTKPSDSGDAPLCSAVDITGQTWVGATRQSLITVPSAGDHHVKVVGRLVSDGPGGGWSLDNSSLVVEK